MIRDVIVSGSPILSLPASDASSHSSPATSEPGRSIDGLSVSVSGCNSESAQSGASAGFRHAFGGYPCSHSNAFLA